MNFADLLTLTKGNFVDGRIVFRRRKTHKVYSILMHSKAQKLFNLYRSDVSDMGKEYVLPFVVCKNDPVALKKDILQAIKNTNDYLRRLAELCEIDKCVTTYYARYSWANIARGLGYSKDLIAEALGHEYGNKVTGIYLDNYSSEIIDKMNVDVITSVLGNGIRHG
jgi:integrase